jgi:hypothetical protein
MPWLCEGIIMIIDSGDVLANANQRAEWNRVPLEDVVLVDMDGNKIKFTEEEIERWKFIGLNNMDFLLEKIAELSA